MTAYLFHSESAMERDHISHCKVTVSRWNSDCLLSVKVQMVIEICCTVIGHRGQGGGGYDNSYGYQNRGQRYDDRRSHGDQRYYDDDSYYDSRSGSGGGSPRGRDNYYDDRQRGDRGNRSRYTYRADEQHTRSDAYNTRYNAPSADQSQPTTDMYL